MKLLTPLYNLNQYSDVYEPSEDTHLFLDALEKDCNNIVTHKPTLACEIGSGSGILISALAGVLQSSCAYFSTDINLNACQATQHTAQLNNVNINPAGMNLMSMFRCRFDLILFNPPYVVTGADEIVGRGLNRAYAGGWKGREIIDEFLESLPSVLADSGVCYLLLLRDNDVEDVKGKLGLKGFKSEVVLDRKIPGEWLYVYKFFR